MPASAGGYRSQRNAQRFFYFFYNSAHAAPTHNVAITVYDATVDKAARCGLRQLNSASSCQWQARCNMRKYVSARNDVAQHAK